MTIRPILYSFRRCPYAMRARLALLVSGTICEIREVKLSTKPPEMIAASKKATVPVLVLPEERVIDESLDIMRWCLRNHDPEHWLDCEDSSLIAANDGPFKHHLDRFKYADRHGATSVEHRAAGLEFLKVLEARLESRGNLCNAARGMTDMAILPFVRQFAETDRAWFDNLSLPALQAWLASHLASSLFSAAMVRLTPWCPGDRTVLFPKGDEFFPESHAPLG
jgi:glutathione S-transferase